MPRPRVHFLLHVSFLACFLIVMSASAAEHRYVEDFTTTTYRDSSNTTAWWDTTAGELKLHEFHAHDVGGVAVNDAWDQVVDGDMLYVAAGLEGLQCYDIGDPTSPQLIGTYNTPGEARGIAVAGGVAFVADQTGGLQMIDVDHPTTPTYINSITSTSTAWAVALDGGIAYVAWNDLGVMVFDVSNPASPGVLTIYNTSGNAVDIVLDGDLAYVADSSMGVMILNISNPNQLTFVHRIVGDAFGVAVEGHRLYVSQGNSGIQILDVANPASPVTLGSYDTPGFARSVLPLGEFAYLADEQGGVQVLWVADPSTPQLWDTVATNDRARSIALRGEFAYVSDASGGVQVLRVAEPFSDPYWTDTIHATAGAAPSSVVLRGSHAYVYRDNDFFVVDVSDPSDIQTVSGYIPGGRPLAVHGDRLYTLGGNPPYLQVFDINDPTNPILKDSLLFTLAFSGVPDVAVAGDWLVVSRGQMTIFDISDRDTLGGGYILGDSYAEYASIVIDGTLVYAAHGAYLHIVDISDPTLPTLVYSSYWGDEILGLEKFGNRLYMTFASNELVVLEVTIPTLPLYGGGIVTLDGTVSGPLVVDGDRVYVAEDQKISIYEVDGISSFTLADSVSVGADNLVKRGDQLYIAGGSYAMSVAEVSWRTLNRGLIRGQSLGIGPGPPETVQTMVQVTGGEGIDISTSDNGNLWRRPATAGPVWIFTAWDTGPLLWRVMLYAPDRVTPVGCSSVTTTWLAAHAYLDSIVDVPGDQGGFARVHFSRSGWDVDEDFLDDPVTAYDVYRRIDPVTAKEATAADHEELPATRASMAHPGRSIERGIGRRLIADEYQSLPPGTWESVATVNSIQQDAYISLVPTLGDSSTAGPAWSTYMVIAHTATAALWYVSEPDSGYSVDNISPGVPTGIKGGYAPGTMTLDWDDAPEPDFQFYRVYRGTDPGFVPASGNLMMETASSIWMDSDVDPWVHHYKISTVDHAGNEGPAGAPETITDAPPPSSVKRFALHAAVPNPFNPSTLLSFELPEVSRVQLVVYDVTGRRIRVLVDGLHEAGNHEVTWDARDDSGSHVSSGVYLYQLRAEGFVESRRVVLLK